MYFPLCLNLLGSTSGGGCSGGGGIAACASSSVLGVAVVTVLTVVLVADKGVATKMQTRVRVLALFMLKNRYKKRDNNLRDAQSKKKKKSDAKK